MSRNYSALIMIEGTENQTISQTEPSIKNDVKEYHFLGTRTERIVFLVLLTLVSCGPIIFGKGIPSHADWHIHIEHAYNFKRCFWQGQLLPRWLDAHVNGYGLPIFNYYAPLVYYIFVFLEMIFRDPILSIKWAFVIPMILCTACGYLYLRKHGSAVATTVAMIFIIFSPAIHLYIYNTNWPGSTLAIAFLFLTLYGIDSFNNDSKNKSFDLKSVLITSFGYAGIALSHLATAFIFTLLAVPYFFMSLFLQKSKKFVRTFFLSLGLGASLGGFYLFPACLEKRFVHADEVLTKAPLWDYSKNFLYTVLDRRRDDGYAWAIFDHRYYEVSNALYGLVVLICVLILLLNMEKVKNYFTEPFRVNIAITMFVVSFLMMTPVSMYVWLVIKPMQTIQFPWRFTSFLLPFGGVVMVYAFDLISKLRKEKVVHYSIACLLSLLLYVDFINVHFWKWVDEQVLMKAAINVIWGNEEYYPNLTNDPNWKEVSYGGDFSPSVLSSNPQADVTLIKWLSHDRVFQIFSNEDQELRLRTFYFPGWTIYIDGRQTNVSMEPKTGAMVIQVPAGKHEIKVKFELTPIRKTSAYISLVALFIYFYLLSRQLKNKKVEVLPV